jgi:hypothetical protein
VKKRSISIIEILIIIFIISISSSVIGIKANRAIEKHHFSSSLKMILDKVIYCHKMASIINEDVFMSLHQDKSGSFLKIYLDDGKGLFLKEKPRIDFFKNIFFKVNKAKNKKINICFTTNGNILFNEKISFFTKNKKYYDEISMEDISNIEIIKKK